MNFNYSSFYMVILSTLFTWGLTALGASIVFFFKEKHSEKNEKLMQFMLAFAAGVMVAASFWSLLDPAIELSGEIFGNAFLIPAIGFFAGGVLIIAGDKFISKSFDSFFKGRATKIRDINSFKRSILMVFAVTLHNFPEGMAVGVAFGVASMSVEASFISAIMLAIGIGLQNFPEGAGVSLPLRREGLSARKSFFYGQMSGAVEPIAAIIGYFTAVSSRLFLPLLLSFSAGAMISVVASELVPEAAKSNKNLATVGILFGFTVMMVLDVALS